MVAAVFPDRQAGLNYLTEGGQETEIMYKYGFDLPHFAMFPLLDDPRAMSELRGMYSRYLDTAACHSFGVVIGAKRKGIKLLPVLDAMAPGVLVAQALGRWGNWFNQELFGKPTDLPWGLEIDPQHRPAGYFLHDTFHPTFLYELTYDLIGVAILLWVDRRFKIRRPGLFALYVSYYCFGRFFEELLRVDPAHHYLGLRLNAWVSIVVFFLSTAFFIWWQFIRTPSSGDRPRATRTIVPTGPAMSVPKGRVRSGR